MIMDTQAHFTNIRSFISTELNAAKKSIYVAVAWFTDDLLFNILCNKAQAGLDVQLIMMDDDINRSYGVSYNRLELSGGKVYLVSETLGTLMHNKFCVVDNETTSTGSYNWSNKAQANHENITITSGNLLLATSFIDEFKRIRTLYFGNDPLKSFDAEVVIKRLEIINILIQINDIDQISVHVTKIIEHQLPEPILEIVEFISNQELDKAKECIIQYLIKVKSLTHYVDVDIEQLKWEIKYLEIEIVSLETEKDTIQKIISDFVHTYTIEFGELLIEILRLKKERLMKSGKTDKSKEYEKVEQEYNEQRNNFNKVKKENFHDLSETDKEELKKVYRKACILCHPDKFTDEIMKEKAHKVFLELQAAYSANDLNRVLEILENLENGVFEISPNSLITSKENLLKRAEYLRKKREDLSSELFKTRNDKTYRKVISIKNMDTFFEEEKLHLQNEINKLKNE